MVTLAPKRPKDDILKTSYSPIKCRTRDINLSFFHPQLFEFQVPWISMRACVRIRAPASLRLRGLILASEFSRLRFLCLMPTPLSCDGFLRYTFYGKLWQAYLAEFVTHDA